MRSGLLLRGVLGAAITGLAFAALAQPAGALEISKHAKDSAETNAVQLKGKIEDGDTYELQVYIAGLAKKPNVVVYLNSAGGNLREGMRLGRFFFQNKIETVVESKTQCASACALAFLGGRDDAGKPRRTKASTGGVGFHSFSREFDKEKNYSAERSQDRGADDAKPGGGGRGISEGGQRRSRSAPHHAARRGE
jgi:hypothetical protein